MPPPPLPSIRTDGSVINRELAQRGPLGRSDRLTLLESQSTIRWAHLLRAEPEHCELLVLATPILKRRHLSVKRRQLVLIEGLPPAGTRESASPAGPNRTADVAATHAVPASSCASCSAASAGASAIDVSDDGAAAAAAAASAPAAAASTCRLIYVDPTTLEVKGSIPWSEQLHAELLPRGQFRIHTPGRTYYLEDASGDEATAEMWVQTICNLQARPSPPMAGSPPLSGQR